ncbi:MAG TPA: response regulator transcription factor [Symbiobacteriaceae bacterium]|nr:response regulator transcription factor [Symbiobacteriaceae bacterium]
MKHKVLVVEDEARIARLIRANLTVSGYTVTLCQNGEEAMELVDREDPDLILLDVMLPKVDGFTVCKQIREFSQVPIIMVTAKDDPADRVMGLNLGADDYLVKPFVVEELLARVKAVLRRTSAAEEAKAPSHMDVGPLSIHFAEHKVFKAGEEVKLSPTEYRLLAYLARNRNRTLTHDDLLTRVWGPEYRGAMEYLRVAVGRLRKKIEADPAHPEFIMNTHGIGYTFKTPS